MRHPKCAGPKCRRVATESGLCHAHRVQRDRGGHLKPLRKYRRKPRPEPTAPVLYVAPDEPRDPYEGEGEAYLIPLVMPS